MNAQQLKNSILQDLFSPKDNWKERELKDIVSKKCPISYGIVQQGDHVEDGIPVVRPVDLHCKFVSRKYLKCTTPDISASYQRTILRGDEILLCVRGTTGIVALATNDIEGCNVNRGIVPLFFDGDIDRMFMYYQLQTPKIQEIISSNTMGSALRQINIKDLRSIHLTCPPIDEQRKVVEILETIMPKVEEYGKAQESLDKLNENLPERLKKSILQEAIEGRLVPQDPNDEPASVLLDNIRKEKARLVKEGKLKKKDIEETAISEDEISFEIPKSWEWCRIGQIADFINGLAFKPNEWEDSGIPIIRIQNLTDKDKPFNYTSRSFEEKFLVKHGDLLFSWSATLDSFIWEGGDAWLNQHIFKVIPYRCIDKVYLYYLLKGIVRKLTSITHGLTMKHLTRGVFENYVFPLPPLAEQKRIVEKIEQLMKEIDKLKK